MLGRSRSTFRLLKCIRRIRCSIRQRRSSSHSLSLKAIFLFFLLSGYAGVGRDLCFLYLRGVVDLHDRDLRHGAYYSS